MNESTLTLGQAVEALANRLNATLEYTKNNSNLRQSLKFKIDKHIWKLETDNSIKRTGRKLFEYSLYLESSNLAVNIILNHRRYQVSNPSNKTLIQPFGLNAPEMSEVEQALLVNELSILIQSLLLFLAEY